MLSRRQALIATGAAPIAAIPLNAEAAQGSPAADNRAVLTTPPECKARTTAGMIQGFRRGTVYTFKGVPYGANTAGAARFMPPQPAKPWEGVRHTLTYGPTSPQPVRVRNNPDLAFVNDWDDGYPSEDCLVLNVWSGAMDPSAKRPVLVWLHGGGFTAGSSQEFPSFDGTALARRGMVVVGMNHRLGPLGFMDLSAVGGPTHSGNVGMLDIVLALQWVRENVARFGGDPGRVTVFGQSGGGFKVSTLMAMPAAKGLFHRAWIMSGSNPPARPQADARRMAEATMAELGVKDVAALQAVDTARLILAGEAAAKKLGAGAGWGPVFDGDVVAEDWRRGAPALSAHVPLVIGSCRDEFRGFRPPPTEAELPNFVPAAQRGKASEIIAAIRKAHPGASPTLVWGYLAGMSWRIAAVEQAGRKHAQGAAPAYSYWFKYQPDHLDGTLGATHCADIAYAFDNVAIADTWTGNTPEAHALAAKVSGALIAFATTGDPSQPGLAWPKFDPARAQTMIFDRQTRIEADPMGEARRLMTV